MSTTKDPKKHKKLLLEALESSLGIATTACKKVGISRNQFYTYCRTDDDFKKAVDDIQEIALDYTESQLYKKIKEGSERSILFYMKYRGRKRGYTESLNIDQTIKGHIDISKLFGFEDD